MTIGMRIIDRLEFKSKAPAMTFPRGATALEAATQMSEKNYGSSIVLNDDGTVAGIVTERDFMRRLLAKKLPADSTPLSAIMTTALKTASPEDRVIDWLRTMSNERFRHLPVLDAEGKLINVMSQGDFVSYTWPELHLGKNYQLYYILGGAALYSVVCIVAVLMLA